MKYELDSTNNDTFKLGTPVSSVLSILPSAIAAPFNKYFIVKSQKELILRKMEDYAETRKFILFTIDHLASIDKLPPYLENNLWEAYYRTFDLR